MIRCIHKCIYSCRQAKQRVGKFAKVRNFLRDELAQRTNDEAAQAVAAAVAAVVVAEDDDDDDEASV